MPRYLYLVRHAESREKQHNELDKERELTARGVREALLIGTYLFKENTALDAVICSVAIRAKVTASLIADAMKFNSEKITEQEALYEASTRTLFQFVSQLDDQYHNVLCIAHNPSISYLAESFTKSEIGDMPAGGLAIIKFNIQSWKEVSQGNGELYNYVYPGMLSEELRG
jgi:phosphohistidine phosphatase